MKLHYKYGLGVVILRNIHDLFHSIYGYDNNIDQFNEFTLQNYNIKVHLNNYKIKTNYNVFKEFKYYPLKKNATSKYHGVSWIKRDNDWQYFFRYKGKQYSKQHYKDELECAFDFNMKVMEIKGTNTTINYLTDEEIIYVKQLKLNKNIK